MRDLEQSAGDGIDEGVVSDLSGDGLFRHTQRAHETSAEPSEAPSARHDP